MQTSTAVSVQAFQALVNEIHDLSATQAILSWDLETYMPEQGGPLRAKQMATLAKLSHNMMTSPEMAEHLRNLRQPGVLEKLDTMSQALVREVGRNFDKSQKTPIELLQEIVETTAEAHKIWVEARANKNFKQFEPVLRKIVSLNQRMAEAQGYEDSPYDALLDDYEPGLTVKQLDPQFQQLKAELVPLLKAIQGSGYTPQTDFLHQGPFPQSDQLAFSEQVLKDMGFDFAAGRLDLAPHPFSSGTSSMDVRLTTRVDEYDVFSALSSSMHEGGHGMYEQGVNPALNRTPLAEGTSLGIHESQSRMWENLVGRSKAFWSHYLPKLQATFPALEGVDLARFYHAINRVQPSFIRVEADEVTYNLHIMVRYEIEKALIEGTMNVDEVPEAWAAKMREYLGITPANDAEGALQDIHWSHGSFGYFPTYTLGNLYSAQFFNTAKQQNPTLEQDIAHGNLLTLKNWLNQEIHAVGKMESAATIVQRVTGEPLNARYFVDYLWQKYGDIFNIQR
ncbi:carboxypeptidase M32 [Vampirovibrio chlorellavorus]|uniref:carboxypeptidase M32 n=1 Tax=Vampirovibrio chlorellavorus TaxID=758823 RepID=UPI0026EBC3FA|nr:carboxypeptidase M32 [Vampirovibrio chlorellavorus]